MSALPSGGPMASPSPTPPSGPPASSGIEVEAEPEVHRKGLDGSDASSPAGQNDGCCEGQRSIAS
eukprot:7134364-Alexandrium_andersonii.AAC.1